MTGGPDVDEGARDVDWAGTCLRYREERCEQRATAVGLLLTASLRRAFPSPQGGSLQLHLALHPQVESASESEKSIALFSMTCYTTQQSGTVGSRQYVYYTLHAER